MASNVTFYLAFLNVHGQSGFNLAKQKQIEDFIRGKNIDILHCQEIHIDDECFSQCSYISSNYYIISNNALNKYGTASIIRNDYSAENVKMDTLGRAIFFEIGNATFGNVYSVYAVLDRQQLQGGQGTVLL